MCNDDWSIMTIEMIEKQGGENDEKSAMKNNNN